MIDSRRLYQLRIAAGERVKEKGYWLNKFAGEPAKITFPTHYKREAPGSGKPSLKPWDFEFSKELSAKLLKLGAGSNVRLHVVLVAGMTLLLYKYSDSRDIIVGAPIYKVKADAQLVNTVLPLRSRLEENITFKQLLLQVKQTIAEAIENRNYPIEVLIRQLNMTVTNGDFPLFDVAILVENIHDKEYIWHVNPNIIFSFLRAGSSISGCVEYNPLLYDADDIKRIITHFKNLMRSVISYPDIKASAIEILTVEEKKRLLVDFNDSFRDYPGDKTIHELFAEQAERTPGRIAVIGIGLRAESIQITYHQLNEKSDQLACYLRSKGVSPDIIVGLMVDRSIEMIVGILGILKAGGAYLPIELDYPEERIRYMLKDSNAGVLLKKSEIRISKFETNPNDRNSNDQNEISTPIVLDFEHLDFEFVWSLRDFEFRASNLSSSNLAYVIYTSGTTGKPKGVLTAHYNVTRVVRNTNYIEITPRDRILQLSNYAFDGSVFDIYGALLNSAALVMIKREEALTVDRLSAAIKKEAITVFFVTTALFNTLVDLDLGCFENVRKVLFGGERVSVEHSRKALEYLGKNRIIHVYGPTETTVYAAYYFIESIAETAGTIPIGKPISNTTVYILDKYMNPVPIGVSGELYIGGTGTARGYLNSPELTAEKFLTAKAREDTRSLSPTHPLTHLPYSPIYRTGDLARWLGDGNIEFIGRIDQQVKIRGFRIELGEIEGQLLTHNKVKEAIVVLKEGNAGTATRGYLCAYLVLDDDFSISQLREYLLRRLPGYMIPSYLIQVEKIPLTPNGKVDHKVLPEPEPGRKTGTVYVSPRSEIEKKLAEIWSEMLGVHFSIGIDDNFFELGGQSLVAMRMAPRLKEVFQVSVPLDVFFQQGTIRQLAQLIEGLQSEEHRDNHFKDDHSLSGLKLERTKRVKEEL